MPAPGDQYVSENIKNPFDERRVNDFTAQEIATLQSRLNKQLGPEFISHRSGAGGSKVAYLEGTKAIALANDVFGFNGWSSSLQQVQVDYVDEHQTGRVNLGLSIIVRVTLKDGTYHEDIGYGTIENAKGKGAAFEKAKKEAATDGLKRALRNFGNVLGNCLYDKEYLKKVNSVKVKPVQFDESRLYRHRDYRPPEKKEEEERSLIKQEHKTPMRPGTVNGSTANMSVMETNVSISAEFDDEFGGNLFDGVDINEDNGDEFTFEPVSAPGGPATTHSSGIGNSVQTAPVTNGGPRHMVNRVQSMPAMRAQNGAPQQQNQPKQGHPKPAPQPIANPPQAPNVQHNSGRPDVNRRMPPTVDIHAPSRAALPQQQQNQPQRATPPQNSTVPNPPLPKNQVMTPQPNNHAGPGPPPANRALTGFVTSRAAELVQNVEQNAPATNLPTFDPKVDSPLPKHLRTPGVDHNRSQKITRESVGAPTLPIPAAPPQQQQQQQQAGGSQFRPVAPINRSSFVNPQHDPNRRIGMPGAHGMSPLANRNAYKPPGMNGGIKRPPLADLSNQNAGAENGPPEAKKPKLENGAVENTNPGVAGS